MPQAPSIRLGLMPVIFGTTIGPPRFPSLKYEDKYAPSFFMRRKVVKVNSCSLAKCKGRYLPVRKSAVNMILICSIPLTSVLHLQCLAPPSHHKAQHQRLKKDFKSLVLCWVQHRTVMWKVYMPPACPKIYILSWNYSVPFTTANDGKMTNLPNTVPLVKALYTG